MVTKKTTKESAVGVKAKPKGRKVAAEKVDYEERPTPRIDRYLSSESGAPKYSFDPAVDIKTVLRDANLNYRWLTESSKKKDLKGDKVRQIKASIATIGVQKPIVLVSDKSLKRPFLFQPVGGFTRLELAVECGLKTVPALILPKDRSEYDASYLQLLAVTDNSQELTHEVDEGKTLAVLESLFNDCGGEATPTWKKMATAITGHTDPDYILRKLRPFMHAPKPVRKFMKDGLLEWRGAEVFIKKTKKKGEIVAIEPIMSDKDAKAVLMAMSARHKASTKSNKKGLKDRSGKYRVDAVKASLDDLSKDGKLDSLAVKPSERRKTPVQSSPSKEICMDHVEILTDAVVLKEACRADPDPLTKVKSSRYFEGGTTVGEEVDDSLVTDANLERAVGICLARAIDAANIEGGSSEIKRLKLTLLLKAYGRALAGEDWLKDKSERKSEKTGKVKAVKNSEIMEDLVSDLAVSKTIVGEDSDGEEVSIKNPTTFDRLRAFMGRLDLEMQETELEEPGDEELSDE